MMNKPGNPFRPPHTPRPSLTLFFMRGRLRRCRYPQDHARRRTVVCLPDPRMYPDHSPPPKRLERWRNQLHRVVMRCALARSRRRSACR